MLPSCLNSRSAYSDRSVHPRIFFHVCFAQYNERALYPQHIKRAERAVSEVYGMDLARSTLSYETHFTGNIDVDVHVLSMKFSPNDNVKRLVFSVLPENPISVTDIFMNVI